MALQQDIVQQRVPDWVKHCVPPGHGSGGSLDKEESSTGAKVKRIRVKNRRSYCFIVIIQLFL